ncbi:MAG: VanW family protein [Clostridia bacterium]|jgi:vancomycin resistance protein YoaR|nr:VanW family protein [Clostridia bacterium]
MSKYGKWILILSIIIIAALAVYFFFSQHNTNPSPSAAQRISTETQVPQDNSIKTPEIVETEISKFSTDILVDDNNRDTNLELTTSKINNYIVKNEEEFSFNKVVGNPTPDKGYEKAGIFVNGKKEKGYGGGNCQVSTTLYDAVLKVDGLKITERHEHGKEVGYVKQGKDATVVYDELDLKFKNNTGYDIKIYSNVTDNKVHVRLVKLSNNSK